MKCDITIIPFMDKHIYIYIYLKKRELFLLASQVGNIFTDPLHGFHKSSKFCSLSNTNQKIVPHPWKDEKICLPKIVYLNEIFFHDPMQYIYIYI